MSEEFTLTFVCVECGCEFTKSYASKSSMTRAKSKAKYCTACAYQRKLERQRSAMRAAYPARKPKPKYAAELDDQKALKEINQKCSAYLAAHGDLQKPGGIFIPKADRAPEDVLQYGDAAAERYKKLTAAKTKKEEPS